MPPTADNTLRKPRNDKKHASKWYKSTYCHHKQMVGCDLDTFNPNFKDTYNQYTTGDENVLGETKWISLDDDKI
eukprot:scaffold184030_cov46-Cyclotella_meneghiniana.AAC.1